MPSPFPGMNPYLEQETVWHDFHKRVCPLVADLLTLQVRPHYIVKIDEQQVGLTAADLERVSFVEVRDRANMQLVTVIELLSPANKRPGPRREQYLAKRSRILASPVHFVEIDWLRGGPRLPMEHLPACDYYVLLSRGDHRPVAEVWPIALEKPLPTIPIPLHAPHADVPLDLQQVLHRIYDAAGYEDYIYRDGPQPPLTPEQAAWARQFVPGSSS